LYSLLLIVDAADVTYRFVVRDFVYDETEINEERQELLKLMDEMKTQFVSYSNSNNELNCSLSLFQLSLL